MIRILVRIKDRMQISMDPYRNPISSKTALHHLIKPTPPGFTRTSQSYQTIITITAKAQVNTANCKQSFLTTYSITLRQSYNNKMYVCDTYSYSYSKLHPFVRAIWSESLNTLHSLPPSYTLRALNRRTLYVNSLSKCNTST